MFGPDDGYDEMVAIDKIDYGINSVPLSWLNVGSKEKAIEYYQYHFAFLPDDVIPKMAIKDYRRKRKWEKKRAKKNKKTKHEKHVEMIKQKLKERENK